MRIIGWFTSRKLKTFNIPPESSYSWVTKPIAFKGSVLGKVKWEHEVQQVKLSDLNLFADTKTKSTKSVLILPVADSKINIGGLIICCRNQGLKSWVLQSDHRYGSRKEFDKAISHFKEKPYIIACHSWLNLIQDSRKFDSALVVDPIVQVGSVNKEIEEENVKILENPGIMMNKGGVLVKVNISELIPEFKTNKKLFLYLLKDSDKKATELEFPALIDNGGPFRSHPLGSREYFMSKILVSFIESLKTTQS